MTSDGAAGQHLGSLRAPDVPQPRLRSTSCRINQAWSRAAAAECGQLAGGARAGASRNALRDQLLSILKDPFFLFPYWLCIREREASRAAPMCTKSNSEPSIHCASTFTPCPSRTIRSLYLLPATWDATERRQHEQHEQHEQHK